MMTQLRCFKILKVRKERKQVQRFTETPIIRRLNMRKKKTILNTIVERALLSMKLKIMLQATTNLLKRTALHRLIEVTL